MPTSCVAYKCVNRGKMEGITYHRFPQDEKTRRKWINAINRNNWEPKNHSRICSSHFREADIDRTSLCLVRIRDGAVPSIFLGSPEELQEEEAEHDIFVKTEVEDPLEASCDETLGNVPDSCEESHTRDTTREDMPDRKRKLSSSPVPSISVSGGCNLNPFKPETEFDLWTRSIALQLNNMGLKRALQLQLKLQTLLTEDRINQCDGPSAKPPQSQLLN
uniref:THAP-type domain-containing protein n=1 Tax=Graphocephala atropunctata TaxID=36148 RepID=A0A1B6LBM8_9HEMI